MSSANNPAASGMTSGLQSILAQQGGGANTEQLRLFQVLFALDGHAGFLKISPMMIGQFSLIGGSKGGSMLSKIWAMLNSGAGPEDLPIQIAEVDSSLNITPLPSGSGGHGGGVEIG